MASGNLLAAPWLSVEKFVSRTDLIELHAKSRQKHPPCPLCQTPARRVQSRYSRQLADLPWQGVAVRIRLQVRRFFCDVAKCPRRVFTERLPELAAPYARRTLRLAEAVEIVGFALGGEPGARTATALGMKASPDTVLRAIRRAAMPVPETPRVLGIDDWALRRGHRYATVLVDLERHCRVDVLPDRKAETVKAWLEQHPGVEVISRDRGGAYAEGARCGAPSALQVADRWHLLKNLGEAVERFLATRHQALTAVGTALTEEARREQVADASAASATTQGDRDEPSEGSWRSHVEQQRHAKRARRLSRYQRVIELFEAGWSRKAIARETHLDIKTVRKYLAAPSFPEQAVRRRRSRVDPYRAYLEQRWTEGCRNATQLHRELCERGYSGGVAAV